MSDGEAAAGQKESQFIRPKLKATRAKVFACILALFGALVISIQVYVYVTFEYVGQPDSLIPDMFLVTNATAMASGLLALLSGILSLACVTPSRTSSTLKFNVFLHVMDAILAVAGLVLASILSDNINTIPQVCDKTTTNCSLFFGLQVSVAALCGADFILSLALIIIISIGVRGGRQQTKSTTSQIQPIQEVEPVETIIHQQLVPIPEEIIQVEPVQFEEPSTENQEPEVEELSPIEQLKFLSREELERRLQEHFQHQFLEELRSELNRRNLTEPDSLKEPASHPDYDLQTEHVF